MGYKEGADLVVGFKYPFQHFNRMKNHFIISDPLTALTDAQPGMIAHDLDDDKLYHFTTQSPGFDQILQETFSYDASPIFQDLELNLAGVHDNNQLTLRDSGDISHPFYLIDNQDVYSTFRKAIAGSGGLNIRGFSEINVGFILTAYCNTSDTTRSTAGIGAIILQACQDNGAGDAGGMDANANVVVIRANRAGATEAVAIFDEDGDLDLDATANDNQWDEFNDLELAHDFSRVLSKKWNEIIKYNAQKLHDAGLIHFTPRDRSPNGKDQIFIRMKQGFIFTLCTFAQIFEKFKTYDKLLEGVQIEN